MVDHNVVDSFLHGKNSKGFLIGGVVVGALVIRQHLKSKSSIAAADASTSVSDTTGADYGSGDYGNYSADTAGLFSYADPATGATISGTGSSVISSPTTNGQWSQQVQAMLIQQGYNPTEVGAAIGHFIVGTQMTPSQWDIVQVGIALEGRPPQPVPTPNVAATGSTASAPRDGYYVQIPTNFYYQVQAGKRYALKPTTVSQLKRQGIRFTNTLINNPIYGLPRGNPYQI